MSIKTKNQPYYSLHAKAQNRRSIFPLLAPFPRRGSNFFNLSLPLKRHAQVDATMAARDSTWKSYQPRDHRNHYLFEIPCSFYCRGGGGGEGVHNGRPSIRHRYLWSHRAPMSYSSNSCIVCAPPVFLYQSLEGGNSRRRENGIGVTSIPVNHLFAYIVVNDERRFSYWVF